MIKDLIGVAPNEVHLIENVPVIVSRQDLAYQPPLPPNAKMAALYEIVKAHASIYRTMVLFAKKQQGTPYAIGFPYICDEFGVTPIITYPATDKQTSIPIIERFAEQAVKFPPPASTEFIRLHPNMVSINVNQSRKIAEERHGFFIPFGFDHRISVETHANHFHIPDGIKTVVMATMTGMTLAGAIFSMMKKWNIEIKGDMPINFPKFIGISCGRPPENVAAAINKYIPLPDIGNLEIFNPYPRNIKIDLQQPFPLHPDYELKAWYWLTTNIHKLARPIYFINVGR